MYFVRKFVIFSLFDVRSKRPILRIAINIYGFVVVSFSAMNILYGFRSWFNAKMYIYVCKLNM